QVLLHDVTMFRHSPSIRRIDDAVSRTQSPRSPTRLARLGLSWITETQPTGVVHHAPTTGTARGLGLPATTCHTTLHGLHHTNHAPCGQDSSPCQVENPDLPLPWQSGGSIRRNRLRLPEPPDARRRSRSGCRPRPWSPPSCQWASITWRCRAWILP